MRKVHASTSCDAGSVCARRIHKPRDVRDVTAVKMATSFEICQTRPESATVTEFSWKHEKWNAVNPSS